MSNKALSFGAVSLLLLMFFLALASSKDDSLTMDELAHLPAGYSYLVKRDMRLNPEHPPLIKDLAAFPLLFIEGINFPEEARDWQEDINGQWGFGSKFLFQSNNPAREMIFWSRIPMILVMLALGAYVFWATRDFFGEKAGLLALFLYVFSPTFLAHGRLVTTDVASALGIFIATYHFIKFLQNPSRYNVLVAGLAFGVAQLLKFTAFFVLVPLFGFLTLSWLFLKLPERKKKVFKLFTRYFLRVSVVFIISLLLVVLVYQYHVAGYPASRQARDIEFLLSSHPLRFLGPWLSSWAKVPPLRALAQYLFGLALVFQRAIGGHTTYFLGEVSAGGWKTYFPTVYLIKEPLTFHLLTVLAILWATYQVKKPFWRYQPSEIFAWLKEHFVEFSFLAFIGLYWTSSLTSDLNIGVRHLLPTFPFVMVLIASAISNFFPFQRSQRIPATLVGTLIGTALIVLLLWQAISVIAIYPHFLAYFNELAGGPDQGYIYTVDSNLDWGQDLKRLNDWLEANKIKRVYLDYFGGSDASYYLEDKYRAWWGGRNPSQLSRPNYLAVSATALQAGRGLLAPGFNEPTGYYRWLDQYEPVAKIGYSIFVYYIE